MTPDNCGVVAICAGDERWQVVQRGPFVTWHSQKRELPKSAFFFSNGLHIPHGLENSEAGFRENLLHIVLYKSEVWTLWFCCSLDSIHVLHLLKLWKFFELQHHATQVNIGAVGCHDPMPWRAIDLSAPVKVCLGHQLHAALHVSTLQTPCRSWRLRVSLHEKMQNKWPSSKNMRLVKQLNTNAWWPSPRVRKIMETPDPNSKTSPHDCRIWGVVEVGQELTNLGVAWTLRFGSSCLVGKKIHRLMLQTWTIEGNQMH